MERTKYRIAYVFFISGCVLNIISDNFFVLLHIHMKEDIIVGPAIFKC